MSKLVIADTSCLIALDNIDHLFILEKLFAEIHITTQIQNEYGKDLPNFFQIHAVENLPYLDEALDPGEASALTLALSLNDVLVIIDERKGRKVALELDITIIGTLKILLIAKQKGVIAAIKPLILSLEAKSFRFSKAIISELLLLAGE